jgi:hypothetical protein
VPISETISVDIRPRSGLSSADASRQKSRPSSESRDSDHMSGTEQDRQRSATPSRQKKLSEAGLWFDDDDDDGDDGNDGGVVKPDVPALPSLPPLPSVGVGDSDSTSASRPSTAGSQLRQRSAAYDRRKPMNFFPESGGPPLSSVASDAADTETGVEVGSGSDGMRPASRPLSGAERPGSRPKSSASWVSSKEVFLLLLLLRSMGCTSNIPTNLHLRFLTYSTTAFNLRPATFSNTHFGH